MWIVFRQTSIDFSTPQEPAPDARASGSQVRKMCQESGWDPQVGFQRLQSGLSDTGATSSPMKIHAFCLFLWESRGVFEYFWGGGNIRCCWNKQQ